MGFWSTLGKIGTNIAPYALAPFTGGASMAFAPMANQLGSRIGGSGKLDNIFGSIANVAGMYGGNKLAGKMGGGSGDYMGPMPQGGGYPGSPGFAGGIFGGTQGNQGSGLGGFLGGLLGGLGGSGNGNKFGHMLGNRGSGQPASHSMGMQNGLRRGLGHSMGFGPNFDSHNPDLSFPLMQGRNEAIMNQPWRSGGMPTPQPQPLPDINQQPDYTREHTPRISPDTPIMGRRDPFASRGYM